MGNAIINGGGIGADSDELTAYKQHILEGYTAVTHDSDGEPINGTMPNLSNRSKITHTSSNSTKVIQGDEAYLATNSDGVARAEIRYNGDVGYITGNTLFGIEQSKMAAAIGLTTGKLVKGSNVLGISGDAWTVWTGDATAEDSHILSGKTYWKQGVKRTGTMAIQNPDVSGTDRIAATNRSCWDGTVCLGVRNGRYLNGVNWVQFTDPNFKASNFKKGVPIMGLTGTFEGYVPTATDLYNNGNNSGALQNPSKTNNTVIFESGMFTFPRKDTLPAVLCTNKKWNMAGFSRINIDIDITDIYRTTPSLSYISLKTSDTIATDSSRLPGDSISYVNVTLGRKTFSLAFTGLSYTKYLIFNFAEIGAKVYRVWLN